MKFRTIYGNRYNEITVPKPPFDVIWVSLIREQRVQLKQMRGEQWEDYAVSQVVPLDEEAKAALAEIMLGATSLD